MAATEQARRDVAEKSSEVERLAAEAIRERRAEEERLATEIDRMRRERLLPDSHELDKIERYEAHLRRELYPALRELEAMQARRRGQQAPLARLDVTGVAEN